jgi:hypothetical protein
MSGGTPASIAARNSRWRTEVIVSPAFALDDEAALRLDDFPFAIEEELFLRLEVVEDRRDRDVGGGGHLRHGHVVEAALDEHFRGDVGDREAALGFLALAKAGLLGGHRRSS